MSDDGYEAIGCLIGILVVVCIIAVVWLAVAAFVAFVVVPAFIVWRLRGRREAQAYAASLPSLATVTSRAGPVVCLVCGNTTSPDIDPCIRCGHERRGDGA